MSTTTDTGPRIPQAMTDAVAAADTLIAARDEILALATEWERLARDEDEDEEIRVRATVRVGAACRILDRLGLAPYSTALDLIWQEAQR